MMPSNTPITMTYYRVKIKWYKKLWYMLTFQWKKLKEEKSWKLLGSCGQLALKEDGDK